MKIYVLFEKISIGYESGNKLIITLHETLEKVKKYCEFKVKTENWVYNDKSFCENDKIKLINYTKEIVRDQKTGEEIVNGHNGLVIFYMFVWCELHQFPFVLNENEVKKHE